MIEQIELTPVHTPRRSGEVSQHVLVHVRGSDGVSGYGEMSDLTDLPATMPDLADLEALVNEVFVGIDPSETVRIGYVLTGLFSGRNDPGLYTGNVSCGLDAAFHDLAAKRFGVSLSRYLGGPTRTKIRTCFPLMRMKTESDIEEALHQVESLCRENYTNFRLYVGHNPDADEELVARLARDYGARIRLQAFDCSGKLDPVGSAKLLSRLVAIWEPEYVESVSAPDDFQGMRYVREKVGVRISEHVGGPKELLAVAESGACDVVNVMPTALGSIRSAIHMFAMIQDLGLYAILSTTQSTSIGTAVELAIGAAVLNVDYPTVSVGPKLYTHDLCASGIQFDGDYAIVPTGLGIGVQPDPRLVTAATAPLSWTGYEFETSIPDRSDVPWKEAGAVGIQSSRVKKH